VIKGVAECGTIVVAGGGIGGAAVAVALQQKRFDVVVLEVRAMCRYVATYVYIYAHIELKE